MERVKSYLKRVRDYQLLRLSDYLRSRFGDPIEPKIDEYIFPKLLTNIQRLLKGIGVSNKDITQLMQPQPDETHPDYVKIITEVIKPFVDAMQVGDADDEKNEHNRGVLTLYLSILKEEYKAGMVLLWNVLTEEAKTNQNLYVLLESIPYNNKNKHLFSMMKDFFDNMVQGDKEDDSDKEEKPLLQLTQGTMVTTGGIFAKVHSINAEITEVVNKLSKTYFRGVKRALTTDHDSFEVVKKMKYKLGGGYYIDLLGLKKRHRKRLLKRLNKINGIYY